VEKYYEANKNQTSFNLTMYIYGRNSTPKYVHYIKW